MTKQEKIQPQELRIGNYVNWNGEIAIVSQLLELDVYFKCGETDLYENINSIPITDDWLLNFGFIKDEWDYYFPFNGGNTCYGVSWYGKELYFAVGDQPTKEFPIKYVHQLQNLYLALTGEELTLN